MVLLPFACCCSKTLQVLTLLWTLLRQGPDGVPVVNKAIVVAPATLVENWGKEVTIDTATACVAASMVDGSKYKSAMAFRIGCLLLCRRQCTASVLT